MRLRLAALGVLLFACGGPPQPTTAVRPDSAQRVPTTAVRGPKLRVAVGQFGDMEATKQLLEEMGWKGIAPVIAEQVVTGLAQSGRVAVFERSQLDKVAGILSLEKESGMSRFFDQSTTAEMGKFLGAQVVFVGAITEFEPNVTGSDSAISFASLAGLKHHKDKAVIGIDVRFVDQQTGRVLHAAHARGEVLTESFGGDLTYKGIGLGSEAWSRTPIGEATRQAAEGAIRQLVDALQKIPFEAPVLDVRDGNRLFVGAGHDAALQIGDRLRVVHRGEAITDAAGNVVGHDEAEGGWCEVQTVQEKMSVATLVDGKAPKKGDLVRFPLQ